MATHPALVSVSVADDPALWKDVGFAVEGSTCRVGGIAIELGADGKGIRSCAFSDVSAGSLDGLDIEAADPGRGAGSTVDHSNGTVDLDHLVVTSHDPLRTRAALEDRGFVVRRMVEMGERRYTFFRVGETILELVGPRVSDGDQPARFFGLAFTVADIDATAARLGSLLGDVRDAVQPGRQIATLRRDAGLSVPVAFMSKRR